MPQQSRITLLAALLLLALLSSACQPALDEGWKLVESESLGIAIAVPDTWAVSFADGALYLGSTQNALDRQDFTGEAGVSITPASLSDLKDDTDPLEIVDTLMIPFSNAVENLVVTQEITSTTLMGYPAATTAFTGMIDQKQGLYTLTAAVMEKDQNALMIFTVDGSEDGHFAAILAEIVASVSLK
jgi:hypothetical protein